MGGNYVQQLRTMGFEVREPGLILRLFCCGLGQATQYPWALVSSPVK